LISIMLCIAEASLVVDAVRMRGVDAEKSAFVLVAGRLFWRLVRAVAFGVVRVWC